MEIKLSEIEGLIEFFPKVFHDERGFFLETYNQKAFENLGLKLNFMQDNQSFSKAGVLRGLHFQKPPFEQGKLVRVVKGKCIDVVVDIRKGSKTFGMSASFILDDIRQNMVYIPAGFAHGFATFEETIFHYKCTNIYDKASEGGILWNDPQLNIDWQIENPNVSEKDAILPTLEAYLQTI
jgi:dTDP-4-dehydrorhamnose 3,5-epimerase